MDLIERQAAIDAVFKDDRNTTIKQRLEALPSVQTEVVRCKDCKHVRRWRSKEAELKFGQVYDCAYVVFLAPRAEDFCSHAERRSDD